MFFCLRIMWTTFTNNLVRVDSPKHVLDEGRLVSVPCLTLYSIKEDVREFINIHLFTYVSGIAIIIFKSIAKLFRNVKLFITTLQIQKHLLNLIQ